MDWLLCLQNSLLVVQPLVARCWLGRPKSPKLQCPKVKKLIKQSICCFLILFTFETRPIPSAISTKMLPVESKWDAIPVKPWRPKKQLINSPIPAKPNLIFNPIFSAFWTIATADFLDYFPLVLYRCFLKTRNLFTFKLTCC